MDATATLPSVGEAVVFRLDGQRYALPLGCVQEIQQIVAMTPSPEPGPAVVGLVNLRGVVVPAMDLRTLLGMPPCERGLDTPMIVAHVGGGLVALLVDEVEDVVALPEGCLQPPEAVGSASGRLLAVCRVESQLVFLLDPERLSVSAPAKAPRSRKKVRSDG